MLQANSTYFNCDRENNTQFNGQFSGMKRPNF